MNSAFDRQAHAVLDLKSRYMKGLKIERLLKLNGRESPIKLLEVGTGSGGIAHYFATHHAIAFEVDAVDVLDNRIVKDNYRFTQTTDTKLPFDDQSFDVVISNHVIEHVGDGVAQLHHLVELQRVLKSNGSIYLAVPNRWMLVEPHYRVAFLSWIPAGWRSRYLRLMRKGKHYDCVPLALTQLERLIGSTSLVAENITIAAFYETLEIERGSRRLHGLPVPQRLLYLLRGLIPTLIFRLYRKPPTV